ncbi:MAG: nitrate ABC transporter substrate-binding protein, partial [Rhodospirillaceae bacterium]
HPDRDLRLIVVPPPQMGTELSAGTIDGFCSGGPWNQAAVLRGLGHVAITGYELWNNAPEKVLGVSQSWAQENPNTHLALIRALIEAACWLDDRTNLAEAADILASDKYVGMGAGIIESSLLGKCRYGIGEPETDLPDYHVFHRHAANFPWVSHGVWILSQMYRWGQLTAPVDLLAVARSVYRPDLYRAAALPLGVSVPVTDMKQEGAHRSSWRTGDIEFGPDKFVDDRLFDPAHPVSYLEGFEIHSLRLPPDKITLSGSLTPA